MNSTEIWVPISGFEGLYEFKMPGIIRSLDRELIDKDGRTRFLRGKVLKVNVSSGYLLVGCSKDNIKTTFYIHRIIAGLYVPNPLNLPEVNHKNGIKTDNNPSNLEWVSSSENNLHAIQTGLRSCAQKLNKAKVLQIIHLLKSGLSPREIALRFNIDRTSVVSIKTGRTWSKLTCNKRNDIKKMDMKGSLHPGAKLNEIIVSEIRQQISTTTNFKTTRRELLIKYSLPHGTLDNIIHKRTWKHIA